MTQSIWNSTSTISWPNTIVTVRDLNSNLLTICGAFIYEFLDSGSISLVASSEFNFNTAARWFSMYTNLPAKVGDWFYKIKVTLSTYLTATAGIKDFKVRFQNLCEPPTSIVPSILAT